MAPPDGLKVFISTRGTSCGECGFRHGRSAWIHLVEDKGALCLACADLDHLEFVPAGNAALTRRARKLSTHPAPRVASWRSPSMRAASTVVASAGPVTQRVSTQARSSWRSERTCATARRSTTFCWRMATSGTRQGVQ
jgi:hypothetical protein